MQPQSGFQGRLALRVGDSSDSPSETGTPVKSFSASFELTGDAARGELRFFSPLGSQLAQLEWAPTGAVLTTNGETRLYASRDDMMLQATGAEIPVPALLAWLQGQTFVQAGWQVDLAQYAQGRIQAQRLSPLPRLDLRIALDK